jgi:hypothetical protein
MSCLNSSAGALATKDSGAVTPAKRQPPAKGALPLVLGLMSLAAASHSIAEPLRAPLVFKTLDFGTDPTFLTGIRGDNIVGNYVIPGTTETGGLLYNLSSGVFSAFPVPTANGANYPGAIGSSPYGPSFGSQLGVLNAVGSYKVSSSPYDLSYLYSGASGPGANLTPLTYPGTSTLDTIAHSTFGNQVVGNYDTRLATGNAFIYSINTGTYQTNNFPGPSVPPPTESGATRSPVAIFRLAWALNAATFTMSLPGSGPPTTIPELFLPTLRGLPERVAVGSTI